MSENESTLKASPLFNNSLEKGIAVIRGFSAARRELNLAEIAAETGMGKSAAQRFAYTLETLGYLRKNPKSKKYALTPKCLDLGVAYLQANWLIDHANPFLLDLNRKCGETVNLSEPDGEDMVFTSRFQSHKYIAIHMPVGRRLPMFCTASGRAYLSALNKEESDLMIRSFRIEKYTPQTIDDPLKVIELVDEAREKGYSFANEEYYRGDINIAAPVRDASGHALGAINVSLPTSRWSLEAGIAEISPLLLETTRAIITSPPR